MKSNWLLAVLLTIGIAEAQSVRVTPVNIRANDEFPKAIQFFCAKEYGVRRCEEDAC